MAALDARQSEFMLNLRGVIAQRQQAGKYFLIFWITRMLINFIMRQIQSGTLVRHIDITNLAGSSLNSLSLIGSLERRGSTRLMSMHFCSELAAHSTEVPTCI
jgi:hypothetical protein